MKRPWPKLLAVLPLLAASAGLAAACGEFSRPPDDSAVLDQVDSGTASGSDADPSATQPGAAGSTSGTTGTGQGEGTEGLPAEGAEAVEGVEGFVEGAEGFTEGVEGGEGLEGLRPEGIEGAEGNEGGPPVDPNECESSAGCALVPTSCCSCGGPGSLTAIPAHEADAWMASLCQGGEVCDACESPVEPMPQTFAQCSVGQCVVATCPEQPDLPDNCWGGAMDKNGCWLQFCQDECPEVGFCADAVPIDCDFDGQGCPKNCRCPGEPPIWETSCWDGQGCVAVPADCCTCAQIAIASGQYERYMRWLDQERGCGNLDCDNPAGCPPYEAVCPDAGNLDIEPVCELRAGGQICDPPPPGKHCQSAGTDDAGCPIYKCGDGRWGCIDPPVCPDGVAATCEFDMAGCPTACVCPGLNPGCVNECANGRVGAGTHLGDCACWEPAFCGEADPMNCEATTGCMECPTCGMIGCINDPYWRCTVSGGMVSAKWPDPDCFCPATHRSTGGECVPLGCPDVLCDMACAGPMARDENGCPACRCAVPENAP